MPPPARRGRGAYCSYRRAYRRVRWLFFRVFAYRDERRVPGFGRDRLPFLVGTQLSAQTASIHGTKDI